MKRLLLATAAVLALAVAAPMAAAQYTSPPPATAPYTTPIPDDPTTPQDESVSAMPDTTATQSQSQVTTQSGTTTTTPNTWQNYDTPGASAQTTTTGTMQAQTTTPGMSAQTTTTGTMQAQAGEASPMDTQTAVQGQTHTYDQHAQSYGAARTLGENTLTMASLEEHARDAGMDRLPMTAQEVCMPRDVELTSSSSRLNHDARRKLINATDRASVCDLQRIVIRSPNGRADAVRQTLIDHGLDASEIEVMDSDGGLGIEMQFAGIATSNEAYAQMYNPQQFASASHAPGASSPGTSSYAPSTSSTAPSSSDEGVWLGDPNAQIPATPTEDEMDNGMTPTSDYSAAQPALNDI